MFLRTCTQLNLHRISKDNLSDYFSHGIVFHKNMGFDALDFPMKEITSLLMDKSDSTWRRFIEKIKNDADASKIKFEICHLPYTIWNRISHDANLVYEFEKMMISSVDVAALLGVDYAVLHPNSVTINQDELKKDKEYESCMKHLAPIADYAKKRGVHLALENLAPSFVGENLYRYSQSAEEVCKMADSLDAGVCWDFGHANISGLKQSKEIENIGKRLCVLHINDNNGYGDDHLLPFMGTVDWKDAMYGLKKINFKGLLNFEIATTSVPFDMREIFSTYLTDASSVLNSYLI